MIIRVGVSGVFSYLHVRCGAKPFPCLAFGPQPTDEVGTIMSPNFCTQVGRTLHMNKGRSREVQELAQGGDGEDLCGSRPDFQSPGGNYSCRPSPAVFSQVSFKGGKVN